MFDPKPIMKERILLEPIPTPDPAKFPLSDEVPDGCKVIEGLKDDWGYYVDIHTHVIYAKREINEESTISGNESDTNSNDEADMYELELNILEPKVHFGVPNDELNKQHKWPCIVYVQGSAFHEQWLWNHISRHIRIAEKGYVVAIVQYRPAEVAPFPAQMQDAKTAIRFLKKNAEQYHIDVEHMAIAGDSSGGHTALLAGFTGDDEPDTDLYSDYSAKVNCIIDAYGPTVFSIMNYYESSQNHYNPDSPEGYEIGHKNVLVHQELADATIPMNYLSKYKPTPPTLIVHGGRDMLVPFNQSCQLYNYMKKMGKEVTFYKIKDAGHGCLGFDNDTFIQIILDFLKRNI